MKLSAAQYVDGGAPEVGGRQRCVLDVATLGEDAEEDGLRDVLGVGRAPGDAQGRPEYRLVMALVQLGNPASALVEVMGIRKSSMCVLAKGTVPPYQS